MAAPYGWLNRWPQPMPQGRHIGSSRGHENTMHYACLVCAWRGKKGEDAMEHHIQTAHDVRLRYGGLS